MKFDTLDDGFTLHPLVYLAMAQICQKGITVTANNPCRYHTDVCLNLSFSFYSFFPSYNPSLFLFFIFLFPLILNFRNTRHSDEVFLK